MCGVCYVLTLGLGRDTLYALVCTIVEKWFESKGLNNIL
ncbi:hypothetical protein SLEP1_g12208 [Rubroshorea leprosula]|uniref:Uncharacterized protein n=1 Tax=Rubroshorea leprosula TaxID=152421 RepID=A0AAV5IBR2_9ROSI|nr:hypothetical protein SLEP1_g12208 [Rubroshorea leprosula]